MRRKNYKRRMLSMLLVIAMLGTMIGNPVPVTATEASYATGDFTVTATDISQPIAGGTDYTYESGVLTIKTEKKMTIANTDPNTPTTDRIVVATGAGKTADITLAGINIDMGETGYNNYEKATGFAIASGSEVILTLAEESVNSIHSSFFDGIAADYAMPGMNVPQGTTLILNAAGNGSGSLNVSTSEMGYDYGGAGIGGQDEQQAGTIVINGGIIKASGITGGAGIGGGINGDGGSVKINGGTVEATGGEAGAGIGGGFRGSGGTITISGGTVEATGGVRGAGIGGGADGAGGTVTISGGTVEATGGSDGAGIGGGQYVAGGTVTISGGTVVATGGGAGAGIGGGNGGAGGRVAISGGTVMATAPRDSFNNLGAGIGGGYGNGNGTITVTGGSILESGIHKGTWTDGVNPVYLTTVKLKVVNAPQAVTAIGDTGYGTNDMKTDDQGRMYLYLPTTATVSSVTSAGNAYQYNSVQTREDGTAAVNLYTTAPIVMSAPDTTFSFDGEHAGLLRNTTTALEYSLNAGTAWNPCTDSSTSLTIEDITADHDIQVRVVETDRSDASESQIIDITKAAPPATEGDNAVGATACNSGQTDGALTGITTVMEYRKQGDSQWKSGNATGRITGLAAGQYEVRVAVTGTVLASDPVLVTVPIILAGDGNTHPYQISNAEELYTFASIVNGTDGYTKNSSAKAVLMNDIELNPGITFKEDGSNVEGLTPREWIPIGIGGFAGSFDGQNHTIAGVYVNLDEGSAGLFGGIAGSDAVVQNVRVVNSYIKGKYAGGISTGLGAGTIQNCHSEAVVDGEDYVGGICGVLSETTELEESIIQNCSSAARINSGGMYVGGICGQQDGGMIQNCANTVAITGNNTSVGGICGYMYGGAIKNCYNTANVTGSARDTGAICGWYQGDNIENSYYLIDGETPGIGRGDDTEDTTGLSAADFQNGKAAYLLNSGNTTNPIWRQNLDRGTTDSLPVADSDHGMVYYHEGDSTYEYSNYKYIHTSLTNKNYPTSTTYNTAQVTAPMKTHFSTNNTEATESDYTYTWYVGQNADGSITGLTKWSGSTTSTGSAARPTDAGSYTLLIQQAETKSYVAASTTVKLTINKAANAPNTPAAKKSVTNSVKTVGLVSLPTGWTWAASDRNKSLVAGKTLTATANYTAADAANYQKITVKIAITRAAIKVKSVTLNQTVVGVKIGKTVSLKTTVAPSNATNKAVTYKSSNTKVATVSSTGKIKGIKSGTCTITVTAKDGSKKKDTVKVTVSNQTITYKLNKGKNSETNPETYLKSQTVNLKNPTRKGYTFKGWYTNSKFKSSSKLTKIKKGNTKNFTLYAKWQKVTVAKAATPKLANSKAGQLKVTYAKTSGASGYELTYATNSKFTKNKVTTTLKGASKTFTKLKKNTNYYVRIRAYKTDSTGAKVYGKYSSTKSLRLKK